MSAPTPRLRMFAGPNGSGKSTIKEFLHSEWLGVYVNADEIEKAVRLKGSLDLSDFDIAASDAELQEFLSSSALLAKAGLTEQAGRLSLVEGEIQFGTIAVNSYFASVLADFIRNKLLAAGVSFTFETVMSSPDKVEFLHKAQQAGFRTYLYYVATEDPEINIDRVRHRVATGGHPVPEDKIISRYARSLDLVFDALAYTDRAYIFDNSGCEQQHVWIAEVTNGDEIEMKTDQMPVWFKKALWDKFDGGEAVHG